MTAPKLLGIVGQVIVVRRLRVFTLSDADEIRAVTPEVDVEISGVTADVVGRVADFRTTDQAELFRSYLDEGQYGVYAWHNCKVVGHVWAKACGVRACRVNGYMDIGPGEALLHFGHVHPDYRGRNIYTCMMACLCERLFSEAKVRRIVVDTHTNNAGALRAIAKVGFRATGTGTYVQVAGHLVCKRFVARDDQFCTAQRAQESQM